MVKQSKVIVGGIIKHSRTGYGFKSVFPTKELAQKYKSMICWILTDDKHNVTVNRGYYDTKEMK